MHGSLMFPLPPPNSHEVCKIRCGQSFEYLLFENPLPSLKIAVCCRESPARLPSISNLPSRFDSSITELGSRKIVPTVILICEHAPRGPESVPSYALWIP
jgi:hypothetical protein